MIRLQPESEIMERKEFSAAETHDPRPLPSGKKKNKNKPRFSDEQIRLLESMFELERKLEPRKKVAVARELGLHPRQVAIWFQNRRARGKSKQMEEELRILKAGYDSLASQFEILKEEKKALLVQLQKLNGVLDQLPCGSSTNEDQPESRGRQGLQEELEEAEMEDPYDFQRSGIMKWIEDEGWEVERTNPDEQEEKSNCPTFVDEEGRQFWDAQRLNSSLTSPSLGNSCCSSEWLHFWT